MVASHLTPTHVDPNYSIYSWFALAQLLGAAVAASLASDSPPTVTVSLAGTSPAYLKAPFAIYPPGFLGLILSSAGAFFDRAGLLDAVFQPGLGMLLSIFLAGSQELAEITLNLQS